VAFDAATVRQAAAGADGSVTTRFRVPAPAKPGPHSVSATGQASGSTASATFTVQTDWTHFRFDRGHTGVQPFENVLSPANAKFLGLDWQAQLGDLVYGSSPAVVGGVAYIGSIDGVLWAYPADGCGQSLCSQPLWQSTYLAQILDSPAVASGVVYVGSQTDGNSNDGKLNAFDAKGCPQRVCPPLWQGLAGPDSNLDSSPVVAGGVVYVGSYDGKLYAFHAAGCGLPLCQPLWTGATGGHTESSPVVVKGVVYMGSDDGFLYAFPAAGCGAAQCAPLWKGSIGGPVYSSSPAVASGVVYVGSAHALAAFRAGGCGAAQCRPLWRGTSGQDFFGGSPAIYKGRVYIGLESMLAVFDANGCGQSTCSPLWYEFGTGFQAAILSSPTIANGVVYAGRNTGDVLAWRAAPCAQTTCHELWIGRTGDPIVTSSPTVVNGKLYIGSADDAFPEDISGRLYVFGLPAARD